MPEPKPKTEPVIAVALTINGKPYNLTPLETTPEQVRAFRLAKWNSADVYDVWQTYSGIIECTCPAYEYRHRDLSTRPCKHGYALQKMGILD